ncbi:MAG: ATPase V [Candidatus Nitrosotenuis sp.]
MASLAKLVDKLKQQKLEAAKIRRKNERLLKEAKSLNRRSSSGLHTIEKKIEDTREKMGEINVEFNQILARKESLERLIKAAEDRLRAETEAREQAQIELENADSDEARQSAADRLAQITEKIQELKSEIKQRQLAAQKIVGEIDEYKKSKSKTSEKIHKQVHVKPTLLTLIKKSRQSAEKLQRKVEIATKKEELIAKNLEKATKKLQELKEKQLAKKRKEAALRAAKRRMAKKRELARKKSAKKRAMMLAKKKKAALKRKAKKVKKKPRR